jgi:uncharacterized protein (TIGR00369 family)
MCSNRSGAPIHLFGVDFSKVQEYPGRHITKKKVYLGSEIRGNNIFKIRSKIMIGKRVDETMLIMAQTMNPQDANPAGNVHGGIIMKLIDTIAGAVATRHARANVVTVSIDRLVFYSPVFVGDLLTLKASLNMAGTTSMEVGVRVEAENLLLGEVRHTASAYLTMVALGTDGRPLQVPPLILETDEELRRNREAIARKKVRLEERKKEKADQASMEDKPKKKGKKNNHGNSL